MYDNFSTDNTRDIAESMGCEVSPFGIMGELNDREYIRVKNHCWKGSDADWVIVCDADEILFNGSSAGIIETLFDAKISGASIIKPQGYSMYSNAMSESRWTDIKTGIPDDNYSKLICFRPDQLTEIGFIYGCHDAMPEGNVKYFNAMKLLHYKYVGGIDRTLKRHRLYKSRLSAINKRWNLGHVYSMDENEQIDNFKINLENSKEVI